MARPLRIEYPGAVYHVTVRGNERRDIYSDDADRDLFLELLGTAVQRFGWTLTAYVLMSNHFHLALQLTRESLSRGMHWLNATYSQAFNRRHDRVGHLFQGRYHAALVDEDNYLREVLRYVVLNPVRAKMVVDPGDYVWSSYRATVGDVAAPGWLAVVEVLALFGDARTVAEQRYRHFVLDGVGDDRRPWDNLVGQIYLGSDGWLKNVRERVELKPRDYEHPQQQRYVGTTPMSAIVCAVADAFAIPEQRVRALRGGTPRMLAAWLGSQEGLLPLTSIAAGLRLRSSSAVAKLIRRCEEEFRRDTRFLAIRDQCVKMLRRVERTGEV